MGGDSLFLSDIIQFESSVKKADTDDLVARATADRRKTLPIAVLELAREALKEEEEGRGSNDVFGAVEDRLSEETYPATARWDIGGDIGSPPSSYVESSPSTSRSGSSWPSTGDWPSAGIGSEPSTFSASATPGARPKRKPAAASAEISVLELDSSEPTFLEMPTETGEVAELPYTLPPFQSVVELTTAFQPPKQSLSGLSESLPFPFTGVEDQAPSQTETVGSSAARNAIAESADGTGRLADGTAWEKRSGEEFGANGFWKRWYLIRGQNVDGTKWEECWWEVTDWGGMRQMGARKSGRSLEGSEWLETWEEKFSKDGVTSEPCVERAAHKWCRMAGETVNEWEEQWGESYKARGKVTKWAYKWGILGKDVWHEKWGEDYAGYGSDHCVKWTDRWSEVLDDFGNAVYRYGDKWREEFEGGHGEKRGEVWNTEDGGFYKREWGEDHYGDGNVRRFGGSNKGEEWDYVEHMDTYYNPTPHFGFDNAVRHSPNLFHLPVRSRDSEHSAGLGLEGGIDDL